MSDNTKRMLPHTVILATLAVIAAVLAVVFGLLGVQANPSVWSESAGSIAEQAGYAAWSGSMLVVAVVFAVGAAVLSGMRALLRRAGLDI